MKLPRFVLGMLTVLLVFALVTYALTGAFWSTVLETLLCGVLIQMGYFLAVVFLVSRNEAGSGTEKRPDASTSAEQREDKPSSPGKIGVLQSLRRLGTLK